MESAHSQVKNLSHWEGPGDEDQLEAILYCQCQHDMVREETWLIISILETWFIIPCHHGCSQKNHSLCFPAVYRERLDTKEKPDTAQMVLDAASLLSQAALGVTQDHFQLPWTAVHQNCLTRLQHR
jgi:hypothetical protein